MRMKKKRLFGILLILALVLGLIPGMSLTAYADDTIYEPATRYNGLSDLLTNNTEVTISEVPGKTWYVIAYDSTTVTLLSKDGFGNSKFNSYPSNNYAGSDIKKYVDGLTGAGQPLAGISSVISDLTLIDASTARKLSLTKRIGARSDWWTSSPGNYKYYAVYVAGDSGHVLPFFGGLSDRKAVRPALKLDLSSVIFESASNTFLLKSHTQDFTYSDSDETIMATCSDTDGDCTLPPSTEGGSGFTLFRLDEGIALPRTGFSAVSPMGLSEKPMDLNYKPLRRTLEIPSVSAAAEIVSVPFTDGEYPVTWLDADAGLLEGSAMPGKGQSVLTGQNHLNTTEAGPFANLNAVAAGDHIFILDERGNLQTFIVYANVKVAENDISSVNRLIEGDPQSLTLITCEDERPEGGYASRRVVAARPM